MLAKEIANSVQAAIAEALASGQWQLYQGPQAVALEQCLPEFLGQSHAQLTSSGTAAMEMVLRAAGIGDRDEVLLSSYDYPGNFWAIERIGARPVLVDTAPGSWRVSMDSLEQAYQPTCKALIISHLHGELQDGGLLRAWCEQRDMLLIEDACQALGATRLKQPAGSSGHAAVLSFGGGKLLSCGRGGAWATSDEALAIKARVASGAGSGPYAMSELQAVAVLAQLPWLDEIHSVCRAFFAAFNERLKTSSCNWNFVPQDWLSTTAFYQCGWQLPKSFSENSNEIFTDRARQDLIAALRRSPSANGPDMPGGLAVGAGFPGFHRRSARRCRAANDLSNAIEATQRTLVLHHSIAIQQQWTPDQLADWTLACLATLP